MNAIKIDGDTATISRDELVTEVEKQSTQDMELAVRRTRNYLEWFNQEYAYNETYSDDELLSLVAQHTGQFGTAQRILHELRQITQAFDSHSHRSKKAKAAHEDQKHILLTVFLSKLLKESFPVEA